MKADWRRNYGMLILYVFCYFLSILFSATGQYIISGILLDTMAAGLYIHYYRKTRRLLNLEGLLSFFWNFGIATACLKLSRLSSDWALMTWASFLLFYLMFLGGFRLYERYGAKKHPEKDGIQAIPGPEDREHYLKRVMICIVAMAAVSFAAFLLEACVLGFVPLFIKDTPHAYSYFHLTGVHYFTVSSVMVHPLTVIYLFTANGRKRDPESRRWISRREIALLVCANVVAASVPFLCVSRFFMIMAVALTAIVYVSLKRRIEARQLAILVILCLIVLIPAYVILTVFRSHSVSYLNEIFEMKNPDTPIFITQPYMYIANNYENFNCLVTQVTEFKHGIRQLYPLEALTGLKFILPASLVSTAADFVTKTELTTVTILYDAYYDFGIAGVVGFGAILGWMCGLVTDKTEHEHNPIAWLLYGQIAMYLVLSFFTTWFSNPTTWFWIALTLAMYLFTKKRKAKTATEA